jgi:hypothetical protein
MTAQKFRIESDVPFTNRLIPPSLLSEEYGDWNTAVAVAAKCITEPVGHEMRVVNRESGEVVFRGQSLGD